MRTTAGRSRTHGLAALLAAVGATLAGSGAHSAFAAPAAPASGDASDVRTLPEFDRVSVHGGLDATVAAGGPRDRVVVRGAAADLGRIVTQVRDGTLIVAPAPGARGPLPRIAIAVPVLRGLHADGSATVRATGIAGTDVQIESGGSSAMTVAGRIALESVSSDGSGTLDATRLAAGDATVDAHGSGAVRVRCSGTLTIALVGSGSVRWLGNPRRLRRSVRGSGEAAPL